MEPFLKELAVRMVKEHEQLDTMTFVFPNRRAALYFQYHLAQSLEKPKWAPKLYSIEEYFKQQSDLQEPDRLTLIYKLHQVYSEVLHREEAFDRFYYWGEMLLRDFDEIDKYLVNASQLFKDLSKIKELDESFDYLTEEQKKFLFDFWIHFEEKASKTKENFLQLWQKLPKVYNAYTKLLRKERLAYEGMIHRDVAEQWKKKPPQQGAGLVFAGFNALTKAEAVVITTMVAQGAKVFWDFDAYYTNDPLQEAGQFMRQYRDHSALSNTFTEEPPSNIKGSKKTVVLTGVPQKMGQVKLAGDQISKLLETLPKSNLAQELAKTVIVLPDESLLLPVLHSLPEELKDINVTMGYPLKETPMFNLLDLLVEMQLKRRGQTVSHREVIAILSHSYVATQDTKRAGDLRKGIIERNRVYVSLHELTGTPEIYGAIFKPIEASDSTAWLLEVVQLLGSGFSDRQSFDREYAYHFYQHLARLSAILAGSTAIDWRGYQKLFRQVLQSQKIPFTGEPLRGLQIMGVLETRNLDFDNVIFLSLNEGQMPAASALGSYVPHAVRKAYGLPTHEHKDAIYAYLFYRLLQRSENVWFYYNTEPDIIGNGEISRFVQQVMHELNDSLPVEHLVLHNPIHVNKPSEIEIIKTPEVLTQLDKFLVERKEGGGKLSPSSLNDYLDCGLRFYLKHVAGLYEANDVDDDIDARSFGNIIHDSIYWFYEDLKKKNGGKVTTADLKNKDQVIEDLIEKAFRKLYKLDETEELFFEGQRIISKSIARTFLEKILEVDAEYAPFDIDQVEATYEEGIVLSDGRKVRLVGKVDRSDKKGSVIRIIDYKTGGDESGFESIESLFARDAKRNKAAFQTFMYAYVFSRKHSGQEALMPGLMNRRNLFEGDKFSFGHHLGKWRERELITDVKPYLPEFSDRLHQAINEIYDPAVPFRQTTYEPACEYCPFNAMCRRN